MDQIDGPMAGSVMDTGHFESGASKAEDGYWYGLLSLRMELFGLKMD